MRLFIMLFFATFVSVSQAKKTDRQVDLDACIVLPDAYAMTPEALVKKYGKSGAHGRPPFQWLNKDKTRAIFKRRPSPSREVDLTILGGTVPIEEAVIDFKDGKFLGITISIFNRGDGGVINETEFARRYMEVGKFLGEQLAVSPRKRVGNIKKGVMTHGYTWSSPRGKAVLLCNPNVEDPLNPKVMEFMRMRLARKDARGLYAVALIDRSKATVRKSSLSRNVKKDNGDVYIARLPMVDQGSKGYCVVATAQRLFEYYGIACDMHQLAQLSKADPQKGTNTLYINEQLGRIDYLFKTRFSCLAVAYGKGLVELEDNKYVGDKVPRRSYDKFIKKNIDLGIPLLWSMELGLKPEEPKINPQANGGHMRMIIGYNEKENKIIFSDSWGAGHEFKKMDADDAYSVTQGLYLMIPTVN